MFEWLKSYKFMSLDNEGGHLVPESSGCSVSLEEGFLLYSLVRLHRPKTIVEIGTCTGFSTKFLAQGLRDNNIGGKVYTIDVNPKFQDCNAWEEINIIHGTSQDVLSSGQLNNIDFAFIDGDHTASSVRLDIDLILKHAKNNCIISLHDMVFYPELLELWQGLPYEKILFRNRTGIGVIQPSV